MNRRILRKEPLPCGCLRYTYDRTIATPCAIMDGMPWVHEYEIREEQILPCSRCRAEKNLVSELDLARMTPLPEVAEINDPVKGIGWHWLVLLGSVIYLSFYLMRWTR